VSLYFIGPAEADLDSAVEYYAQLSPGLAVDFLAEIDSALSRIAEHPRAWQTFEAGIRRCLLHRFPYAVVYVCEGEEIIVIAVPNLHRKPRSWRSRLGSANR
jgi:plasmid stabilization system protein ParE